MKKIAILLISLCLFSCKKEDIKPSYDNSALANTEWYATNMIIHISFTDKICTEKVNGLPDVSKEYFLVGDKIHFYSLDNNAYTVIYIKGDTMYWDYKGINNYTWMYIKKK